MIVTRWLVGRYRTTAGGETETETDTERERERESATQHCRIVSRAEPRASWDETKSTDERLALE